MVELLFVSGCRTESEKIAKAPTANTMEHDAVKESQTMRNSEYEFSEILLIRSKYIIM